MNLSYKEIRTYSPMGRWNSRSVADWLCMPLSPFFFNKIRKVAIKTKYNHVIHDFLRNRGISIFCLT